MDACFWQLVEAPYNNRFPSRAVVSPTQFVAQPSMPSCARRCRDRKSILIISYIKIMDFRRETLVKYLNASGLRAKLKEYL